MAINRNVAWVRSMLLLLFSRGMVRKLARDAGDVEMSDTLGLFLSIVGLIGMAILIHRETR